MPANHKACPDTDSLILLIQNELDAVAAQQLRDHLDDCPLCEDEHKELLELESIARCLRDYRMNQRDEQRIKSWQHDLNHVLQERSSGIAATRPNPDGRHN